MPTEMSVEKTPEVDLQIETFSSNERYGSIFSLVADYAQELGLPEFSFDAWQELDIEQRATLYERAYDLKAQEDAVSRAARAPDSDLQQHGFENTAQPRSPVAVQADTWPERPIRAGAGRHASHRADDDQRPCYSLHHIQHADPHRTEMMINAILREEALYLGRLF